MTNLPFNGTFKCTCEYARKNTPRLHWLRGFHTGIDLVGITDKTVYSVCDGIVLGVYNKGAYGKHVKVRDVNGNIFLFAHLSNIFVSNGQKVNRTTRIGIMGSSGHVTGAHLHLEMRDSRDSYYHTLNIADYLRIPNRVGEYNSKHYEIDNNKDNIYYAVHVQEIGWQDERDNGEIAGTEGQGKRVEAIIINADIPVQYRVHVQDKGWSNYVPNGCVAGTTGESKRIEAIEIISSKYEIKAQAHVENIGWQDAVQGTHVKIGTEGQALRLEALKLDFIK